MHISVAKPIQGAMGCVSSALILFKSNPDIKYIAEDKVAMTNTPTASIHPTTAPHAAISLTSPKPNALLP